MIGGLVAAGPAAAATSPALRPRDVLAIPRMTWSTAGESGPVVPGDTGGLQVQPHHGEPPPGLSAMPADICEERTDESSVALWSRLHACSATVNTWYRVHKPCRAPRSRPRVTYENFAGFAEAQARLPPTGVSGPPGPLGLVRRRIGVCGARQLR